MADKGKFTELLATAVASGVTIRAAASTVGCSESHAYHLSGKPEFKQRVAAIRTEATGAAVGRLTEAAVKAVDTLLELLGKENDPPVRLQASKAILVHLQPLSELGELRDRIDALEKRTVPQKPRLAQ